MADFRSELSSKSDRLHYVRDVLGLTDPKSKQYKAAYQYILRGSKGLNKFTADKYAPVREIAQAKADKKERQAAPKGPVVSRETSGRDVGKGDALHFQGTIWISRHQSVRNKTVIVKYDPRAFGLAPDQFSTYEEYLFMVWNLNYFGEVSQDLVESVSLDHGEQWSIRLL